MDNLVGQTLGQFQIVQELGRGGMAVVYKAYQPALQRYVALKVLPRQFAYDEGFVKRFKQEAIAAARLRHSNIVSIYDVGQVGDIQFIVMELLEGQSLGKLVRQAGPMPPARAANLVSQVALALDYAHKQGFVHRDIKPSNVMVDAHDHATLTDFGIARAVGASRLTQTGAMVGTPEYMAPEQIRGLPADHRADVYALGVVCYELLAGKVPFTGDTATVLYKQAHEAPPPLAQLAPTVPPGMAQAVSRALAKNPDERFQSASEFAAALAGGAVARAPQVPTAPIRPAAGRVGLPGWLIWAAGGGVLVLVCLALVVVSALLPRGGQQATPPPTADAIARASTTPTERQTNSGSFTATPEPLITLTVEPAGKQETATIAPTATATPTPFPTSTSPPPTRVPTSTPYPPTGTPTPACPQVSGPFAGIWQSAQAKLGCAKNDAHATWMAEEYFERGVMYWRQDQDKYATVIYNSGSWGVYLADWKEGDPEFTCGTEASPPTPKRGFGRAWCNNQEIRNGLGNATNAEVGFNGTIQDFERGTVFSLDNGVAYVLYSGDGWEKR